MCKCLGMEDPWSRPEPQLEPVELGPCRGVASRFLFLLCMEIIVRTASGKGTILVITRLDLARDLVDSVPLCSVEWRSCMGSERSNGSGRCTGDFSL